MRVFSVFIFSLTALSQSSCNKMDSTYREFLGEGPITYTQKVDSLRAFAGRNRVLVAWSSILDPRVKKINITWLGGDKVLEVPVNSPADTVTIIDGLKEGNYVFNFL